MSGENAPAAGPGTRGKRIAGAIAFFFVAVLLLTGVGLLLTGHQVEGWVLVFSDDAKAGGAGAAAGAGRYRKVSFALLGEWQDAHEEPPAAVAEIDGERVEIHGLARKVDGASGFWLVTDPLAVGEAWNPSVEKSVWVALPQRGKEDSPRGTVPLLPVRRGAFVRARGLLRVGLAEVSGVGPAIFRLEARQLWVREPRSGARNGEPP